MAAQRRNQASQKRTAARKAVPKPKVKPKAPPKRKSTVASRNPGPGDRPVPTNKKYNRTASGGVKPKAAPKPKSKPKAPPKKSTAANASRASRAGAAMRGAGSRLLGKGPAGTATGLALMGASFVPDVLSRDTTKKRAANRKAPTSRNRMRATVRKATPPKDAGKVRAQKLQGSNVPVIRPASGPTKVRPAGRTRLDGTETRRRNAGNYGGSSTGASMRQANVRPRNVTLSKKTGVKKTKAGNYPVYSKKSSAAKSFRSAFADARKSGKKTFTWQGRKYTTKVKKK